LLLVQTDVSAEKQAGQLLAQNGGRTAGRACPLCPGISDINLFRYCQGVVDLDAEIPDGAFDLGMAEQSRFIMHLG
jgi:hypothetical protein